MSNGQILGEGGTDTAGSTPDSSTGTSFIGLGNIRRPSWIRPSWSMSLRRSRSGSTPGGSNPTSPTTDTAVQTPVSVPPSFEARLNNTIQECFNGARASEAVVNGVNHNGRVISPTSATDPFLSGPGINTDCLPTASSNGSFLSGGTNSNSIFELPHGSASSFLDTSTPPLCRTSHTNPELLRLTHIMPDEEFNPDSPLVDSGEGSSSSSLESLHFETGYALGRNGLDERGNAVPSSLTLLLRAALKTLKKESDCREEKLATLERVKELVVDKEEQREKMADDMVGLGYPEVYSGLVKRYIEDDGRNGGTCDADSTAESPIKTRWKILEIIYLTCVKISDKSAAFGRALTEAGLLKITTDTLNREEYKNKCTGEVSDNIVISKCSYNSSTTRGEF